MASRLRALALALTAAAILAPAAQADVLVHQPESYVSCGEPIVVGVW
jgi:hypothetical protein